VLFRSAMIAGILADDYKVERFKKELIKRGFTEFKVLPCKNDCTMIQVDTPANRMHDLGRLCKEVELHFKRSN
jgi:hypothetical protein